MSIIEMNEYKIAIAPKYINIILRKVIDAHPKWGKKIVRNTGKQKYDTMTASNRNATQKD